MGMTNPRCCLEFGQGSSGKAALDLGSEVKHPSCSNQITQRVPHLILDRHCLHNLEQTLDPEPPGLLQESTSGLQGFETEHGKARPPHDSDLSRASQRSKPWLKYFQKRWKTETVGRCELDLPLWRSLAMTFPPSPCCPEARYAAACSTAVENHPSAAAYRQPQRVHRNTVCHNKVWSTRGERIYAWQKS